MSGLPPLQCLWRRSVLRLVTHSPRASRNGALAWTLALLVALISASITLAESYVWVDEHGTTHLTDDPEKASRAGSTPENVDALRALWADGLSGPVARTPVGASGSADDRVIRILRGAVQDLQRGETARAIAALRSARRLDPKRPETYWYLALLDRQRGRYGQAARNLRLFLDHAGPELEKWRVLAGQRLRGLEDERRLADAKLARGPLELIEFNGAHFQIQIDAALNETTSKYAVTAMEFLEDARAEVSRSVGVTPLEPLGVVFYGRAAYSREHAHRFSFQTVGFFDGRIHVSSPAHPSGMLRSLLFHEYTHAVFREETGGDRPYWFNEGLAEHIERAARKTPTSTRSERASLRRRIDADEWIPLRRLAPSFSGLSDEDARAAYLESVVAVQWINEQTQPAQRRQILVRLGRGFSMDQALHEILGIDTDGLDERVQAWILSEFPST